MEIVSAGSGPASHTLATAAAIDHELSEAAQALIDDGVAANTRRAYQLQAEWFSQWCAETGRTPLPATAETLAEYVTHLAALTLAPSTIKQAMAAISIGHQDLKLSPPDPRQANRALRAYRRHRAAAGIREKQAPPVVADALHALVAATYRDVGALSDRDRARVILAGKRDRVIVTLGFSLMARRSELAQLMLGDVVETKDGLVIYIAQSKTDKDAKGVEVAVPPALRDQTVCPVRAVREWRSALAAHGITTGRLLRKVNRWGQPTDSLTPDAVNRIVKGLAVRADLPAAETFTSHSLRAGGATAAYEAGNPLSAVTRHGRWVDGSTTAHRYIRGADKWKDNAMLGVL